MNVLCKNHVILHRASKTRKRAREESPPSLAPSFKAHKRLCGFRSNLEKKWARWFDLVGLPYLYEPQAFQTPRSLHARFFPPNHQHLPRNQTSTAVPRYSRHVSSTVNVNATSRVHCVRSTCSSLCRYQPIRRNHPPLHRRNRWTLRQCLVQGWTIRTRYVCVYGSQRWKRGSRTSA